MNRRVRYFALIFLIIQYSAVVVSALVAYWIHGSLHVALAWLLEILCGLAFIFSFVLYSVLDNSSS
jgi:hypothetical protein